MGCPSHHASQQAVEARCTSQWSKTIAQVAIVLYVGIDIPTLPLNPELNPKPLQSA
jgi:hypothetical protein